MREYSIDDQEMSWAGIDLKEGAPVGTFVQEAKTAPRKTMKDTGTGKVVIVRNPSRSGQLTVTIDQESKTHQQLLAIALLDDITTQAFPILRKDLNTGAKYIYENAVLLNDPDEVRGTEAATVAWVFGYERKVFIPADGNQNVVGS